MAPRTGPRGVTNEDVANRAGVTYVYRPETPAQQQEALLSYVLGGQAPGYGMKYGGFPTAGYGQAAIEGQAFGIADLARQAAQQAVVREAELKRIAGDDLMGNRQAIASKYRFNYQQSPEIDAVDFPSDGTPMQKLLAKAKLKSAVEAQRASREAELEELQKPVTSQYQADIASQVDPYRQIAERLNYSPSQLAQQIAVSRYGYDPMLAAGLFDTQMDMDYYDRAQQAERQALGFGSTNEEYLFDLLGPEAYRQYQENKALQAYESVFAEDFSETDRNLQEAYGVDPSSIVNIDTDTARQVMNDNTFLTDVNTYRDLMATNEQDFISGEEAANSYAKEYLELTGDPVRAQILLDILRQYSFLIGA